MLVRLSLLTSFALSPQCLLYHMSVLVRLDITSAYYGYLHIFDIHLQPLKVNITHEAYINCFAKEMFSSF
jgi:hypothetical protein